MLLTFRHDDYKWLTQLFPRQTGEAVYGDSWFYITQACRREDGSFGTYFRTDDFFVGLGTHRNHWVLVRPVGLPPRHFFDELEGLMANSLMSRRVFVKKAPREFLDALERAGLSLMSADEYAWDNEAPHDDDTFAEPIANVKESLELVHRTGANAGRLRSKLRQLDPLRSRLTIHSIHDRDEAPIVRMLVDHFDHDPQNVTAYLNMLTTIRTVDDPCFGHFVAYVDKAPIAFFAYEVLDATSAGVYASVARREFPGLSESMVLLLFQELKERNIEFANLGGSETEGLALYKHKFGPVAERKNNIVVATWEK